MGCCTSRPAASAEPPSYPSNQPHASSVVPIASQAQSPRVSTSSRQSAPHRQYLNPAARFNEPLRKHVFVSKNTWTPSRLERERKDFFDTRVSGRPEVWSCIKTAAELFRDGDVGTAQTLMNASGLTVPTGDMVEGVYDSTGAYYQLPDWTIADPSNLQQSGEAEPKDDISALKADALTDTDQARKNEKGKGKAPVAGEGVALKARLSDRATDINLTVLKTDTIGEIIERVREESGITARVRLAYLGRILSESQSLEASGWKEGHVVNAMVFAIS